MKTPGAEDLAGVFKALSDPNRLAILQLIREHCGTGRRLSPEDEGRNVSAIAKEFDLSLSTVSHHLKELKHAGLIRCVKRGQWVFCSVNEKALEAIRTFAGVR